MKIEVKITPEELAKFNESMAHSVLAINSSPKTAVAAMIGEGRHTIAKREANRFSGFRNTWTKYDRNGNVVKQRKAKYDPHRGYTMHGANQKGFTGDRPLIMFSWEKSASVKKGKSSSTLAKAYVTSAMANLYEHDPKPRNKKTSPMLSIGGKYYFKRHEKRRVHTDFMSSSPAIFNSTYARVQRDVDAKLKRMGLDK